jgi:hypothetical protein
MSLDEANVFDNASVELFMYCILLGRFEMAEIFWREAQDQISSALVAVKILRTLARIFDEDIDLLINMAKYIILFKNFSKIRQNISF